MTDVHMPHYLWHEYDPSRINGGWFCCGWTQLGGDRNQCAACFEDDCPEAKAYEDKHYGRNQDDQDPVV